MAIEYQVFMSEKSEKTDQKAHIERFDRLSALMARFLLDVRATGGAAANLILFANTESDRPSRAVLLPREARAISGGDGETVILKALIDWGGTGNPLLASLPESVELDCASDRETMMLIDLLRSESDARRCGSDSVLNRLGEILVVRLLRTQIERGAATVGLLGGLSDPRLSRAIVAMHDAPGRAWRNGDLAEVAGLSVSRFAQLFNAAVGETPFSYLRRWRLALAHQDIARGERIQTVAARYGYRSGEALTRVFSRQFGENPVALRKRSASAGFPGR
jgi:AraC-like DNA-binding protein